MKQFIKYPSLLGSHLLETELRYNEHVFEQEAYSTEKLHGANTAFYVFPNGEVKGSTRTSLQSLKELNNKEVNNIHGGVLSSVNISKIRKVGLSIISKRKFNYVIIFGELFGKGVFNMGYSQVEQGLKEFKVFSIFGVGTRKNNYTMVTKLSLETLYEYFSKEEIVPFEKIGIYSELLREYLNPDLLNVPSVFGGVREGYVLQPTREITFSTSERYPLEAIKIKGNKFLELVSENKEFISEFNGHRIKLNSTELEKLNKIYSYTTIGRLENVISHGIINPTIQNVVELTQALIQDASNELMIEVRVPSKLYSELSKIILPMVKEYLLR